MRKLAKIFTIVAFVAILTTTVVNATASDDLVAALSKSYTIGGETVAMSAADKVRLERYLADHPVTETEKDEIIANFEEAIGIMQQEGIADVSKLPEASKNKVISLVKAAAGQMDLTVDINTTNNTVKVYDKTGKLIESARVEDGKLSYTGNNSFVYIVAPVVAIIAVAAVVIARKKVNA